MSFQVRKSQPSSLAAAFSRISSSMYLSRTRAVRTSSRNTLGLPLAAWSHLCAYSSSTLLSPVTLLDSCFHSAARSPTFSASFIRTTDDSISTATRSSGWLSEPWKEEHKV